MHKRKDKEFYAVCLHCQTQFLYGVKDLQKYTKPNRMTGFREETEFVDCPKCHKMVMFY